MSPILFSLLSEYRSKTHHLLINAALNDLVNTLECSAADKQNVAGVDLNKFLMRMLSSTLGGTLATVPSRIFSKACWTPSPGRPE